MAELEKRSTKSGDTWRVRWRITAGGPRDSRTFTDPRRASLFRDLVEMAGDAMPTNEQLRAWGFTELVTDEPAPGPAVLTVAEACRRYIAQLVDVEPRQRLDYTDMIRKHVTPFFGDQPITDVDRAKLRQWQEWCLREGGHNGGRLGANTVRRVRAALLYPTFRYATEKQDDGRPGPLVWNPFDGLRPPKRVKNPRETTRTPAEAAAVISAAYAIDEWTGDAVVMMIATGMRFGEMFGLARSAVILGTASVEIRQVLAIDETRRGTWVLRPAPKSDDSWRTLPIPAQALPAFTRRCALATGRDGLLLPGTDGPASYTMWRKRWQRVLAAATASGMPRAGLTTHGLRHSFLSVLGADGRVSAKALQTAAGHAHISTSEGYMHRGNNAAVAAAIGDWLGEAMPDAA
jgi:integrase